MTARRGCVSLVIVVLVMLGVAGCSSNGASKDGTSFCAAYQELGDNNPFDHLAMATPAEMQAAFDQLLDAAQAMAEAAPADVALQADRYLRAVRALIAELDVAGFDPRRVDPIAYGRARSDYVSAATALGREQASLCPPD